MAKQDILFLINPNSGRGKKQKFLKRTIDLHLDKSLFNPTIIYTTRAGEASELTLKYLEYGFKEFVAVGGDGTINEIAKVLIHKNAILSIIPIGSGNGLARHLGINNKLEDSIKRINQSEFSEMDVGTINDIPFLCTSGIGFDAFGAEQFAKGRGRGLRNYIKVGLTSYFKWQPISINLNGEEFKIFSTTFGNASQFGNNAFITPKASTRDGLLDCCIIKSHPKRHALQLVLLLFNKKINQSKYVEYFQNKSYEIKLKQNALIHYDGEPLQLDTGIIKIKVLEKALKIKR